MNVVVSVQYQVSHHHWSRSASGCTAIACCSTAFVCSPFLGRLLLRVESMRPAEPVCPAEPVHASLQVKDNESLYPAFYKLTDSRSQITSCAFDAFPICSVHSCCALHSVASSAKQP